MTREKIEFRTHHALEEIPEVDWNRIVGASGPVFLRWRFLQAFEQTGAVAPIRGWAPQHLSLWKNGRLVAVAPAYLKGNSEGEFVFDHSWANFSEQRLGAAYYPKLIVACPFTPATAPRLLMAPGEDEGLVARAFAAGLGRLVEHAELSSAHVLFPRERQASALKDAGMALRCGVQFHWKNPGYSNFEEFLSRYNSKRRNQIRRERKEMQRQGLVMDVRNGGDITPEIVDHVFRFYTATVEKYLWGKQYLERDFFETILSEYKRDMLVVLARRGAGGPFVAGALNYMGGGRLFGRYWGATEEFRCLHFNVCYYQGIEECIARRLEVFEPGAGGEHKVVRGFEPTLTYSAHLMRHPQLDMAVRDFVSREREAVTQHLDSEQALLKPFEQLSLE